MQAHCTWENNFCIDLRNKSYKHFLVINKSGVVTKKIIFYFVSIQNFLVFFFKSLNRESLDHSHKAHTFYKKKLQSLSLATKKRVLNECSSPLEFFLVKCVLISILVK